MRSFAARSLETELMDGADVAPDDFAACMADLAKANTITLARPHTIAWLARATRDLGPGQGFSLLDVGYGYGDMLRVIHRWATRLGLKPHLHGIDLNPRSEPAARAATPPSISIDYRTGDAFAPAAVPPIDFIVSSLVTHHMADAEIVKFLRWMDATAAKGWFINDLHRHWLPFYGFTAISSLFGWHRFVRHDGPVSVARAFRRADWDRLLSDAHISAEGLTVRWRFPFRICVGRIK